MLYRQTITEVNWNYLLKVFSRMQTQSLVNICRVGSQPTVRGAAMGPKLVKSIYQLNKIDRIRGFGGNFPDNPLPWIHQ